MPKAEQEFRMGWDNDILIFLGIVYPQKWEELPWKKIEKKVHKLQTRMALLNLWL
jgi:hypothetical protein